jgi:hypothetical protein
MHSGKNMWCFNLSEWPKNLARLKTQFRNWKCLNIQSEYVPNNRSQWPRGLRCRSSAVRLLRVWVRIPPGAWMFVCCECCVLSSTGLCDGLITHRGESYGLWRVVVCDQETSKTRRLKSATGLWKYNHNDLSHQENKQYVPNNNGKLEKWSK